MAAHLGFALAIFFCLLAICAVRSDPADPRPSDHGLASAKDPGPASMSMAAFFRGKPDVALPEALDLAEPARNAAKAAAEGETEMETKATMVKRRSSAALLTVGLVCGVVGVVLLGAAALGYAVRSRLGSRDGSGFGLVRWRGGSDAQTLRFASA